MRGSRKMWCPLACLLRTGSLITTGIPSLDILLGGGVRTGATTEFFGERGVGKSKIVHQLCVNVQLPPSRGGLEGKAIFIDTEGSFRREWVAKIASALGLPPAKTLRSVLVKRVSTTDQQMSALDEEEIERKGVRLLVVDALNSLFKKEFPPEKWVERHQKLEIHLHELNKLADIKDIAVVDEGARC
jgi:DNA repair protein RadA